MPPYQVWERISKQRPTVCVDSRAFPMLLQGTTSYSHCSWGHCLGNNMLGNERSRPFLLCCHTVSKEVNLQLWTDLYCVNNYRSTIFVYGTEVPILSAPPGPDLGQMQLHRTATRWQKEPFVGRPVDCLLFPGEPSLSLGLLSYCSMYICRD